jgi:hypothetical protein
VIVSAGAIASSALLLQNQIAQDTAGVGLCLHPAIEVIGDFDYEIKGNQGIPMAYTVHDFGITRTTDQTRKEYGFGSGGEFLIESIFLPLLQFSIALSASGSVPEYRRLIKRFNNYAMAGIVVRDDNIGRVSLTTTNRVSASYEPGEKELVSLANGVKILGKMWFALGAKRIIIPHRTTSIIENEMEIPTLVDNIINDSKNLLLGSAHPQSGNKVGRDQGDSVVDSDCKVHGFGNLFVCDASVFPTAVGVNPQITVMGVASIIASRIIKNWDTKYANISVQLYFGGFWKRFTKNDVTGGIVGVTHPYEFPVYAANMATVRDLDGFGRVILLEYTDALFNQFYDVLKIVNDNTILGKAFFGMPKQGKEILEFSMSRKYPFEFMTQEDHEMLYNKMKKPSLDSIVGIWEGQLVSDSTWTNPVFRFRYYYDQNKKIKNDYLFGGTLAGTATVSEKDDHIEMQDSSGIFHDELRKVNDNVMVGKYYSESNFLFRWLPEGLDFLHVDKTRSSVFIPYVLKRVGKESAFRNNVG